MSICVVVPFTSVAAVIEYVPGQVAVGTRKGNDTVFTVFGTNVNGGVVKHHGTRTGATARPERPSQGELEDDRLSRVGAGPQRSSDSRRTALGEFVLPATSLAFTVKFFAPVVPVSRFAPLPTRPTQLATPERLSVQT